MSSTLFEYAPTRSARVRWTLLELGLPFDSKTGVEVFRDPELKKIHPLNKLPAYVENGRPLFESAAICNWLADSHPEKNFVAKAGTWERALHDQWVAFTLAEVEAHLWSTARNAFIYDEDMRVSDILPQNACESERSLKAIDDYLAGKSFFIDDAFSLTDIFVGYALNWAERAGYCSACDRVRAFNARLLAMPNCTFSADRLRAS